MDIADITLEDAKSAQQLVSKFPSLGFQASKLAQAIDIANRMKKDNATIYITFTANMVATGLRGLFAEMCKRKYVDIVITTAGALEHDFIRAHAKYGLGDFVMDDAKLHKKKINRIGNVLVPTANYMLFEEKITPIFEKLWQDKKVVSPSELARAMGEDLKDEGSFLYWCAKNRIPVFCPGITDGAIGLQTYFFRQKRKDFGIEVTKDITSMLSLTLSAEKTGGIILGGGISKHHAIGANIVRGGFNYAIYMTTSQPWDGSLSGARSSEAVSWGKISESANHVTVDAEATLAFPLLVAGLKI